MAKISIGYRDKIAKEATLIASSEAATLPIDNVRDDTSKPWRPATTTNQVIRVILPSVQPIGWVAAMHCTAQKWRIRCSAVDPQAEQQLLFDSGDPWIYTDMGHGVNHIAIPTCVLWFNGNVNCRYIRIDLPGVDVGRLALGPFFEPRINYSWSSRGFGVRDNRRETESIGKVAYLENPKRLRKTLNLKWDAAARADEQDFRFIFHQRFDSPSMLVTLNRSDPEAMAQTLWGYPVGNRPEIHGRSFAALQPFEVDLLEW